MKNFAKPSADSETGIGSRVREWIQSPEGEEHLRNILKNSRVLDRLGSFSEWLVRPEITPGHEAYLVEHGEKVIAARLSTSMFRYFGSAIAAQERLLKTVVSDIRAVSQLRKPSGISRLAGKLNECDEVWAYLGEISSAIEKASSFLRSWDLVELVQRAAARDNAACVQLREICLAMLPHLPNVKGKPVSAETITHVLFLLENRARNRRAGYTSDPDTGDFTDPVTRATCQSLGLPKFNPRRAFELMNADKFSALYTP